MNEGHKVAISDDGKTAEVRLDELRVRGLVGYEVNRMFDGEIEVTIRIKAAGLNNANPAGD